MIKNIENNLKISNYNFCEIKKVALELRTHCNYLKERLETFPLEIEFCNLRCVLISPDEIDSLIKIIEQKLFKFKKCNIIM